MDRHVLQKSPLSPPTEESTLLDLYLMLHYAGVCCRTYAVRAVNHCPCSEAFCCSLVGQLVENSTCVMTFLQPLRGLELWLPVVMGRADMIVIWKDLVLESKPPLVGCSVGHRTLRVWNLSLVNLTQDMPTHTWNPLNAFLFKSDLETKSTFIINTPYGPLFSL